MDWISFLTSIGSASIEFAWLPLGTWTIAALPLFAISRLISARQPVIHYQACIALILSLPLGFLFMQIPEINAPTADFQQSISAYIDTHIPGAPGTTTEPPPLEATPTPIEPVSNTTPNTLTWIGLFSAVAGLTSLWLLIRLYLKMSLVRSQFSYLRPVTDTETLSTLNALTRSLGIKRKVQLLLDTPDSIPCTLGWRKPLIVIPDGIESDHLSLKTTLLHELTHIRRNDYLWSLVIRALGALFIYHPLVHLLCRDVKTYRELSCDSELINRRAVNPAEYAHLLLQFAQSSQSSLPIKMRQPKSDLKRRVSSMQHYSHYKPTTSITFLPIVLLIPALFLSCSIGQNKQNESDVNEIDLSDIGISFNLPDGWVVGEQNRWTPKSSYESSLKNYPADIHPVYHSILKRIKPRWRPNRIAQGSDFFMSTNISDPLSDDFMNGKVPFYRFALTIDYSTHKRKESRELWREGKCKSQEKVYFCKDPKDWQVNMYDYKRVRQLDKSEIPFDADSGFLHEQNFQYGAEEGLHTRWLIYHFFAVKGKKTYHFRLTGVSLQSDKSAYIENGTLLSEQSIADMMGSIRFH